MLCGCYLRKGVVYIPTFAQVAGGGGHMIIEPVSVVPASQTEDLRRALREAIARGNPVVPSPTRANHPKPVMPKYAGVKTWSAFARGTLTWIMQDRDGAHRIVGRRWHPGGGWVEDPDQIVILPPGAGIDELCDRMIAILQENAGPRGWRPSNSAMEWQPGG